MSYPIADLIAEMSDRMEEIVDTLKLVSADDVGLDRRAGMLLVGPEGIVVHERYRKSLDYYGGFEYVDAEYVRTIGDYTFYSREHDRVDEAVLHYMEDEESVDE